MTKEKKQGLNDSVDAFSKLMSKYKRDGAIYETPESLDDIDITVSRLKNPILSFDRYLGGAPAYGKMTTFSALASCGKTSLALLFAGANPDKKIGFVDNEFNWDDASYLWIDKYFGIEKERIVVLQPEYLEEGAEMVVDLCDVVDILIYDGFDSLAPKAEYEGTMEDNTMGLQARVYKKFFRKSMSKIYNSKTAFIVTNHLYENIGNIYEPFKEPGGKGIHDYASQKLYLTRSNITDKDKKIIGQNVNININKDKLTGNRGTKFDIPYDNKNGFDIELDVLNNAVDLKIVDQKGAYFYYDGTSIGQGKDNVRKTFLDNPELVLEISNRCRELF